MGGGRVGRWGTTQVGSGGSTWGQTGMWAATRADLQAGRCVGKRAGRDGLPCQGGVSVGRVCRVVVAIAAAEVAVLPPPRHGPCCCCAIESSLLPYHHVAVAVPLHHRCCHATATRSPLPRCPDVLRQESRARPSASRECSARRGWR